MNNNCMGINNVQNNNYIQTINLTLTFCELNSLKNKMHYFIIKH